MKDTTVHFFFHLVTSRYENNYDTDKVKGSIFNYGT